MQVSIFYCGLQLGGEVTARPEGEVLFVPSELPMPVGTQLSLRSPDEELSVRVERVQEGATPGMWVRAADPGPEVEPQAFEREALERAEPPQTDEGTKSRRDRKKSRKTVMGR